MKAYKRYKNSFLILTLIMNLYLYIAPISLFDFSNTYITKNQDIILIRQATENDFPNCVSLGKQIYDNDYSRFLDRNSPFFKKFYGLLNEKDMFEPFFSEGFSRLLVAENSSNQIVALLLAYPFFLPEKSEHENLATINFNNDDIKAQCNGSAVYIPRLYIDEKWRSNGIGKELLKSIKLYFEKAKKIYLYCYAKNVSALDFYRHLGFSEFGYNHVGQTNESINFEIDIDKLTSR